MTSIPFVENTGVVIHIFGKMWSLGINGSGSGVWLFLKLDLSMIKTPKEYILHFFCSNLLRNNYVYSRKINNYFIFLFFVIVLHVQKRITCNTFNKKIQF